MRSHPWSSMLVLLVLNACLVSAHAGDTDKASLAIGRTGLSPLTLSVPDFDLRQLQARDPSQRRLLQPVVRWETVSGGFAQCPEAISANDLDMAQQGCAVVNTAQNTCTIYTASRTTHSIMGHLIRHCIEGAM
jgi:hypothetical protein